MKRRPAKRIPRCAICRRHGTIRHPLEEQPTLLAAMEYRATHVHPACLLKLNAQVHAIRHPDSTRTRRAKLAGRARRQQRNP